MRSSYERQLELLICWILNRFKLKTSGKLETFQMNDTNCFGSKVTTTFFPRFNSSVVAYEVTWSVLEHYDIIFLNESLNKWKPDFFFSLLICTGPAEPRLDLHAGWDLWRTTCLIFSNLHFTFHHRDVRGDLNGEKDEWEELLSNFRLSKKYNLD